jgi:para-nitrobenzyl esterase
LPEPSAELGQHFIRSALSASDYVDRAQKEYGEHAEVFLKLYPGDSVQSAKTSQQHQFSDRTALGERNLAEEIAQGGGKVFLYYFTYLDIGEYDSERPTLGLRLGADHGAELPYVFGLLNHWSTPVPENDRKLQAVVMDYWTNFATILDPNGAGLPRWVNLLLLAVRPRSPLRRLALRHSRISGM